MTLFTWGIQLTDTTDTAVLMSARTVADKVTLVVMRAEDNNWIEHATYPDLVPNDGVVYKELTNLRADTAWAIALYTQDRTKRSVVTRFRTALDPDAMRILQFGASSCLGGTNHPWPSLSQAATQDFDFFILAGDTVYADGARSLDDYQGVWADTLATKGFRDLSASTSFITTWDDHEVTNNWSWSDAGISQLYANALAGYRQALPWRDGPGPNGIWRRLSWGRTLDILVLDSRGERQNGNYISTEQMDWLKDWLMVSSAYFKIVISSVPFADMANLVGTAESLDRWQGYPIQRAELIDHIKDNSIAGVVFIAGDFHYGQIAHVDSSGNRADDLWEIQVGPAGSRVNPLAALDLIRPTEQYRHIIGTWSYTRFEANPQDGTLGVQFVGDDGEIVAEEILWL